MNPPALQATGLPEGARSGGAARAGQDILRPCADPQLTSALLARINASVSRPHCIMEVCGTHTMAIGQFALRSLLDPRLRLISGPGCPVCVTDQADLDRALQLARQPEVLLATYGDMVRVPGSGGITLEKERAAGAHVTVIYSPLDAVDLAAAHPALEVVFLAVGFETTAPATALALDRAKERRIRNFSLISLHKLTVPAVKALLREETTVEGFLCPGHVSTVIGRAAWDFLARDFHRPAVVAGFELIDILPALQQLVAMLEQGEARVVNAYTRAVREEGNPRAQQAVAEHFEPVPAVWRGLGWIPDSGLGLRAEWKDFDAGYRFPGAAGQEPPDGGLGQGQVVSLGGAGGRCRCGDILRGKATPLDCSLFGTYCTPQDPAGPCMVSSEGACAAYYRYERHRLPGQAGGARKL